MSRHPTVPLPATGLPRPGGALILLFVAILAGLSSCSGVTDSPVPNERPHIRIVRGAVVDQDTVEQVTTISWIGWDNDGYVDHYQYAVDIPENLTPAEINDPATPGIAWQDTVVTDAVILFSTPEPETLLGQSGQYVITDRYLGNHSFHVRSVDDRGEVSEADRLDFTASNITPKTQIVSPDFASIALFAEVGRQVFVRWTGKDVDKLSPDQRPAAYEYKLIPIPSIFSSADPQFAAEISPGADIPWARVPGSTTFLHFVLDPPQAYWFVIRAIDVAGAVENKLIIGQNAFKFSSSARNYDRPKLIVTEATLGRHVFPDEGLDVDADVFADQCLSFAFSSDLSSYGGTLQGYNVGVDPPDIDGDAGFQGWSLSPYNILPICLKTPGTHTVVILCRDTNGEITAAIYNLRVVAVPPRDRKVLLVDDVNTRSAQNAQDTAMDIKERDLVRAMGYLDQDVFVHSTYGVSDLNSTPANLTRNELGRYQTIVWHVDGSGLSGNGRTALVSAVACDTRRMIEGHINAGGALWIIGNRSFGATRRTGSGSACSSFLGYDHDTGMEIRDVVLSDDGVVLQEADFLCRVMRICGGDFREARPVTSKKDGLVRALPTVEAEADGFPIVEADSTAYLYQQFGGIPWVDAAFSPVYGGFELDSLYTMRAATGNSAFNGKVMAFRRIESDPASTAGPLAIFGFSFHELKPGSAEERTGYRGMARAMGEWMRRHQVPSVGSN